MGDKPIALCFVCLGNICRSPTAEGIMKHLASEAGLEDKLLIDSAGTGAYHAGERADARSRAEALRHGIELTSVARQFTAEDFERFDYVLAMDRQNLRDLLRLARDSRQGDKLQLLRSFDPNAGAQLDVPDPYQGGPGGFVRVFDICESACTALLEQLREAHGL